jgi:hypothetical protein
MFANRRAELSVLFLLLVLTACSRPAQPTEVPADAIAITQTLPKLPGGPLWNIEKVGVNAVGESKSFDVPARDKFTILGWAVDQQAKAPAGGVEGVVDGVPYPAEYGRPRPDVATTFGVASYANSGYSLELLGQRFAPGAHRLAIRVLANDRKAYWEVGPYTINLK